MSGPGSAVGDALVEHPLVGKVGFTGSTEVGVEIARKAAGTIKRVTLELGGKSACIVFADADLEKAGRMAPFSVFENAGQDCCARSRLLVEASAKDELLEHYAGGDASDRRGDPESTDTQMGPLVSAGQRETVEGGIARGVEEGATVLEGGARPEGLDGGFYLRPTILDRCTNDMVVAREEIFGPVVSVITFETEDEAIRLANNTPYGLSGSLWTRDGARQLRVARRSGRARSGSTRTARSSRRLRSAATSNRAWARSSAWRASSTTPSSRASSSRPSALPRFQTPSSPHPPPPPLTPRTSQTSPTRLHHHPAPVTFPPL